MRTNPIGQPVLSLGAAPVDSENEVKLNSAGLPDFMVTTHVFTEAELIDPEFDADSALENLIQQLAARKAQELQAKQALLSNFPNLWRD